MQIRRINPNPAINVSIVQYQTALPDTEPNNILEEIVWYKETEVEYFREKVPLRELQKQAMTAPPTRDFLAALRDRRAHV